jgi:hypothetical protein
MWGALLLGKGIELQAGSLQYRAKPVNRAPRGMRRDYFEAGSAAVVMLAEQAAYPP